MLVVANTSTKDVVALETLETTFTSIVLLVPPDAAVLIPVIIPLRYPEKEEVEPSPGIVLPAKEEVIPYPTVTPIPARLV